jgi:hypothetical protein
VNIVKPNYRLIKIKQMQLGCTIILIVCILKMQLNLAPLKKLRILIVKFDTEIAPYEVPAFRAAIAEKVGFEHIIFHNHKKDGGFLYKYPSIQYKRIGRSPAIVCVEEGVDEIHHFFQKKSWDILIGDKEVKLKVASLNLNQITMQVWENTFAYEIRNWLPLSQENYQAFLNLESELDEIEFLEKKLVGNIISMAKGIGWDIDKQIKLRITKLSDARRIPYKQQKLMGFQADFQTNVFIPNNLGLGKGVSMGMGMVLSKRENNKR